MDIGYNNIYGAPNNFSIIFNIMIKTNIFDILTKATN